MITTTDLIHSNYTTFAFIAYTYLCIFPPFLCILKRMWLRSFKRQNISVQVACKSQFSQCLLRGNDTQFLHIRKQFQRDLPYRKLVENCLVAGGCFFNKSQATE